MTYRRTRIVIAVTAAVLGLSGVLAPAASGAPPVRHDDIVDHLARVPGMTVLSEDPSPVPG